MNSATGAIFIADHRNDKVNLSEFIVEGNTFTNNFRNYSGAIYLYTDNNNSKISFKNNKFSKNQNN